MSSFDHASGAPELFKSEPSHLDEPASVEDAPLPDEYLYRDPPFLRAQTLPQVPTSSYGSMFVRMLSDLLCQSAHNIPRSTLPPLGPTGVVLAVGMLMMGRRSQHPRQLAA